MNGIIDRLDYQLVGMLVVLMCLGGLAVILTISGSIAAAFQNKAKAAVAAAVPAAKPAAGTAGTSPELIAALSAAVDSAMAAPTPEMVAVISAAVDAGLDGMSHRIVEIKQSQGSGYAAAGRAEIFASHRIRPVR